MNTMLIDCVGCAAKGPACDDCVVSALLGAPGQEVPSAALADDERAALDVMAEGGLLPPLRLVPITAHRWRRGA
ncbi:hypothetical protein [Propioniciclava sp.]|jgi:hypothetical protein|uniref:hypothetical protein n=1 Tax=Propioniciclava sp. TaxID=2038686 RepID=UPI002D1F9EE0|nr:hypothetical protein [Propioniciclava sp.]